MQLSDGTFIGYSNKAGVGGYAGKDNTPKFNTNIMAFYNKLGDKGQANKVGRMIDQAWIDASSTVSGENAQIALKKFNIKKEKFSETSSGRKLATLAKEFLKDKLSFFTTDMYYPFRNNCITCFSNHLIDK